MLLFQDHVSWNVLFASNEVKEITCQFAVPMAGLGLTGEGSIDKMG